MTQMEKTISDLRDKVEDPNESQSAQQIEALNNKLEGAARVLLVNTRRLATILTEHFKFDAHK